jgi:hypothetical protein
MACGVRGWSVWPYANAVGCGHQLFCGCLDLGDGTVHDRDDDQRDSGAGIKTGEVDFGGGIYPIGRQAAPDGSEIR